jgi:hypothetical protein
VVAVRWRSPRWSRAIGGEEEEPMMEPGHQRGRVPTGGSMRGIEKLLEAPRRFGLGSVGPGVDPAAVCASAPGSAGDGLTTARFNLQLVPAFPCDIRPGNKTGCSPTG